MRALVSGGAGFLGSHIVDTLIADGHSVVALDDLSGGSTENVNPHAELVAHSILEADLIDWLFHSHHFDLVFHCAAYAAEGLSPFIRRFNYTNNVVGSMNLINASIRYGVKCFIFTSSIAVYGHQKPPFREDMTPLPADPYGIAKYAVELDLAAAYKQFKLPYIIFRPHNVFGERQNLNDPYRNVVGIFMRAIMRGEPCPIFGNGFQTRAFTYVSDVAPYIARAWSNPAQIGHTFNIGGDMPCSVYELEQKIQAAFGTNTGEVYYQARYESYGAYCDHSKFAASFGTRATVSLEDGIARMAEWTKTQDLSEPPEPFTALEIHKGLPEPWRALGWQPK